MQPKRLVVFFSLLLALGAQAFDGAHLLDGCTSLTKLRPETPTPKAYWAGYCSGAVEMAVQGLREMTPMERSRSGVCLPGDENVKSIFDPISELTTAAVDASLLDLTTAGHLYIVNYLHTNLAGLSQSARQVVRDAFRTKYACFRKRL
jgi:hypothetical protein